MKDSKHYKAIWQEFVRRIEHDIYYDIARSNEYTLGELKQLEKDRKYYKTQKQWDKHFKRECKKSKKMGG